MQVARHKDKRQKTNTTTNIVKINCNTLLKTLLMCNNRLRVFGVMIAKLKTTTTALTFLLLKWKHKTTIWNIYWLARKVELWAIVIAWQDSFMCLNRLAKDFNGWNGIYVDQWMYKRGYISKHMLLGTSVQKFKVTTIFFSTYTLSHNMYI